MSINNATEVTLEQVAPFLTHMIEWDGQYAKFQSRPDGEIHFGLVYLTYGQMCEAHQFLNNNNYNTGFMTIALDQIPVVDGGLVEAYNASCDERAFNASKLPMPVQKEPEPMPEALLALA